MRQVSRLPACLYMSSPKIVYSKNYYVDIGQHVFPTIKYRLIHKKLIEEDGFKETDFIEPNPATDADILLVHTREYLDKLKDGTLTQSEIMTLELPYSEELVRASYLCAGGTIEAARVALREGVGIHVGGGFHHAFHDHGEGFCVLNDIGIGIRKMQELEKINKAFVIDCDLHQGNGTAAIFKDDDSVFTFSMHQESNYPFFKPKSSMDLGLRDRIKDDEYLGHLRKNVPEIISRFKPELIVYVAGADPYKEDILGNLSLSIDGLKKRDRIVFEYAKNYGIPIVSVLAGGYAMDYNDTVKIHYNTVMTGLGRE